MVLGYTLHAAFQMYVKYFGNNHGILGPQGAGTFHNDGKDGTHASLVSLIP